MTGGIKNIGARTAKPAAHDLFATVVQIAANVRNKAIFMEKFFTNQLIEFKRKSCRIMDLCVFFVKKVLDKRFGACLNQIVNRKCR